MRVVPEQQVVCHVCGARYIHHNRVEVIDGAPRITSPPTPCPRCDAPMRHLSTIDVGAAKDLLLLLVGTPAYVQQFGSPARYLSERIATVDQLDRLMALVEGMNYAAWERDSTAFARNDPELLADVRQIAKIRAATDARAGLRTIAAERRAQLEAERTRHLAIAAGRGGKPRDAW